MKRKTLTGATSYEITDNYVPEYIIFKKTAGSLPSAIRVTVGGSTVIVDLDLAAAKAITGLRKLADMTATYLKIPLADGFMKNKNIQITVTCMNTADSNDLLFYNENANGSGLIRSIRQKIFQTSGMKFEKFAALYVDSAAVSDSFNITYKNGLTHNCYLDELYLEAYDRANSNNTTYLVIDNLEQVYKSVEIIPSADRYVTVMDFIS